jgi:hypothetical protein
MSCRNEWTIRFPEIGLTPFEVRPITMNLKLTRAQYDFCRATFSGGVGDQMKPETSNGGVLDGLTPVEVCYNGQPIKTLLFRPDWVDYNDDRTSVQFHDIQEALASARVDYQRTDVKLTEAYKEVVNQAGNEIIPELTEENFAIEDHPIREVYGDIRRTGKERYEVAQKDTRKMVESKYAVDFDNISAEKAMAELNDTFNVQSWSGKDGELIVGLPSTNPITHVAAQSDSRVWRYDNPTINHGREPVKRILVEGPWAHNDAVEGPIEGFKEVKSWFDEGDDRGAADVRVYGVAERTDIDYGTVATAKVPEGTMSSMPQLATMALKREMKKQNNGTVKIDPRLSGTEVSHPVDMKPGDYLQMVPRDEQFDNPTADSGTIASDPDTTDTCGPITYNETYLINEVDHNVTKGGSWNVNAEVSIFPNVPTRSGTAYYNPDSAEWLGENKIAEDGRLKGGFVTEEKLSI